MLHSRPVRLSDTLLSAMLVAICVLHVPEVHAKAEPGAYVVIPIKGEFGKDVEPSGIVEVIKAADRDGVKHIIFDIDSPGGQFWVAETIVREMMRQRSITFHALVRRAAGSAFFLASSCPHRWGTPQTEIGGEPAYMVGDFPSGSVANAMIQHVAPFLQKMPGKNTMNPNLILAVMLQVRRVFIWNEGGRYKMSDQPKRDPNIVFTIADVETGYPKFNMQLATAFGMVEPLNRLDLKEVGRIVRVGNWHEHPGIDVAQLLQEGHRNYNSISNRVSSTFKTLATTMDKVAEAHPRRQEYEITQENLKIFSEESRKKWVEHTDMCIMLLYDYKQSLEKLQTLMQTARRSGFEYYASGIPIETLIQSTEQTMSDLKLHRLRSNFPEGHLE